MGYLDGFGVILKKWFGVHTDSGARVTTQYPEEVRPKPERFHGRKVLNRYEDGMEKCIGCELCAAICPAKCIYVRGEDNDPANPTSPGERFGYVYEINYLRCIHCDLCVEACPTEAITETKMFEYSFTNREDAIYTKKELLVGDDGRPQQLPWENWDGGFDPARDTSGWMRATSPNGDAAFNGIISWAGELGYGVRPPERATILEETGPIPSVAKDHGTHEIAYLDEGGEPALEDFAEQPSALDEPGAYQIDYVSLTDAAEAAVDVHDEIDVDQKPLTVDYRQGSAGMFDADDDQSTGGDSPEAQASDVDGDTVQRSAVRFDSVDADDASADETGTKTGSVLPDELRPVKFDATDMDADPDLESEGQVDTDQAGEAFEGDEELASDADGVEGEAAVTEAAGDPAEGTAEETPTSDESAEEHDPHRAGYFDAPPEPPKKTKRRFRR